MPKTTTASPFKNYFVEKRAKENLSSVVKESTKKREETIEKIEQGKFTAEFINWVKTTAFNEQGAKVEVYPYLEDFLLIHGDLRLSVVVTGCAQLCKSLSSFLLAYYLTQKCSLSVLYCFAKSNIRDKIVASTLNPLFEFNRETEANLEAFIADNNKLKKTKSSTLYTSFVFSASLQDTIAVPAELQSITVDFQILDEYSQYNPALAAVLNNRMDNSPLFSKAQRFVSTPGKKGTGVDIQLQKCSHVFDAHVHCTSCGKLASLNPLDCLFKQVEIIGSDNETILSYFDENLRVLDWNYRDINDKVNSAYIACQHCGEEIIPEVIKKARMYDRQTHLSVADYVKTVDADPFKLRLVGVVTAPVLRRSKVPIASRLINEALNTENPRNYIEQTLGIPSSDSFDGLTVDLLEKAIAAKKAPDNLDDFTHQRVVGIDVARSSHYACICDLYIPKKGSSDYKYENTIRSVAGFHRVTSHSIAHLWSNNDIQFGFMDINPDQSLAVELCTKYDMYAGYQKHTVKEVFKHDGEIEAGGIDFDRSYSINNQYFINRVIKGFQRRTESGELIYRLPDCLESELYNTTSSCVIGHFLNMQFNAEKNMWEKGSNSRSDWFYSTLFVEVACYYSCTTAEDFSWLGFFQED
jgi:hypothetical protein